MTFSAHYKIIVLSIAILFLSITVSQGFAFETHGGPGAAHPWLGKIKIGNHLGLPIHQDITKDGLSFLNDDTKTLLADQHIFMEADQSSYNHFDNCAFTETITQINKRYRNVVYNLNPSSPNPTKAAEEFGRLLHPIQDFYAHSNWIEMKRTDLVDPWYDYWRDITPFSLTTNDNPAFSFEVTKDTQTNSLVYSKFANKVIRVKVGDNDYRDIGLISGTYGKPSENKCLSGASIPHGSSVAPYFSTADKEQLNEPDALNKDHPKRKGHEAARALATQQTTHEFCRLVALTRAQWGESGVAVIFTNWVQNTNVALSKCPPAQTPVTGISNSTSTSIGSSQNFSIPSWFKNNARWYSQGQITEQDVVLSIENLIQQNVIIVQQPQTVSDTPESKIPSYIKDVFGFWSEGKVSDSEIANSLQYMVGHGIIKSQKISQIQNHHNTASTDPNILKELYLASSWQDYGVTMLLQIKNYEQTALDQMSRTAWDEYANNKDADHLEAAQGIDKLKYLAKEEATQNVVLLKDIKQIQDSLKTTSFKSGVLNQDLEEIASNVNEKIKQIGEITSDTTLSESYKNGLTALNTAEDLLNTASVNCDEKIIHEGDSLKVCSWIFPSSIRTAQGILEYGSPVLKQDYEESSPIIPEESMQEPQGKDVSVLIINDRYFPAIEFHTSNGDVGCPHPHYHTIYQYVLSIDGTTMIDPDKLHCGFGMVDSVPTTETFMTQEQLDSFAVATGLNP